MAFATTVLRKMARIWTIGGVRTADATDILIPIQQLASEIYLGLGVGSSLKMTVRVSRTIAGSKWAATVKSEGKVMIGDAVVFGDAEYGKLKLKNSRPSLPSKDSRVG